MDKKMHSSDLVAGNIERLPGLFPNCVGAAHGGTGGQP